MKKNILLIGILFISAFAYADGDWATSAVSLTKDGGSAYLYILNNQSWTDGDWGSNTAFDSYDFGTPSSLVLNGGAGNGWTGDNPGYSNSSFVVYYRVYKSGEVGGVWSSVVLDNEAYNVSNNRIYDKADANIDVLALATESGTNQYVLEVVMSKEQDWGTGTHKCMVPGGQDVVYSADNAGYMANFTKTVKSDYSGSVVAPTTAIVSVDSIALNAVEGYEYAINLAGGDVLDLIFQDDTVFNDLDENTSYDIYQRVKETEMTYASVLSEKLSVATPFATQLQGAKNTDFEVMVNNRMVQMTVNSGLSQAATVTLISLSGKVQSLNSYSLMAGDNTIDLPQVLNQGVYILQVQMGTTRLVKKIAIQ